MAGQGEGLGQRRVWLDHCDKKPQSMFPRSSAVESRCLQTSRVTV